MGTFETFLMLSNVLVTSQGLETTGPVDIWSMDLFIRKRSKRKYAKLQRNAIPYKAFSSLIHLVEALAVASAPILSRT